MRTIIVGVDGSESSRQALAWAADEAEAGGGEVVALQSWHDPVLGGGVAAASDVDRVADAAKHELESLVARVRESHPSVHVASALVDVRPARALVQRAEGADLLVVGARGRGGFLRLELGSVSAKVARRSSVPVVVVRGERDRARAGAVVVGIDGTDCGRGALRWAADWAEVHDKELHVVLAWSYLAPQGPAGPKRCGPTTRSRTPSPPWMRS
ncbi:universal stress protein [Aquihabitans daechungensis]|uniref:universal stress protein n=1 Tax=Aquihabitans daechungensis TaxID=1052257 RepID=UPI003B9FBED5